MQPGTVPTVGSNCLPTSVVDPIQDIFGQVGTIIPYLDLDPDLTFLKRKSVYFVHIFLQNGPIRL
jgi:hypothetical protein